jgi:hypothetical protein
MINRNAAIAVFLSIMSVIVLPAQDFHTVADGVEYAQFTRQLRVQDTTLLPCNVHVLRIDGTKAALRLVHAKDAAIGLETTSSLANRYHALAAVNAGFFSMQGLTAGDAAGVLQIDKKLLSEPYKERVACGIITRNGRVNAVFGHLKFEGSVRCGAGEYPLSGINRGRDTSEIVLFTPEFHRTTLTTVNGVEITVENGVVTSLRDSVGSSIIPPGGVVLSCSGAARAWATANLRVRMNLRIATRLVALEAEKNADFEAAQDIVGGVSMLVANRTIALTWQSEGAAKEFALNRHPRTAIATMPGGRILLVALDGRQIGVSIGMTLQELAEMLLELGVTDAMNLDGGGSTTMVVRGTVINKPSDATGERAVSDALLVFLRTKK